MLAFHNEHIASCAFLTYFTPDSTTASTSPTALTTAAAATILNDKQALTGILMKPKTLTTNLTRRLHPYDPSRVEGMGVLKHFHAALVPPYAFESHQHLHEVPLKQRQHQHQHQQQHEHHHHHPQSHSHSYSHPLHHHPHRILKDYIANTQQMPSLILATNSARIQHQDEQHQFVLNRTTQVRPITAKITTTTTTKTTPTTTSSSSSPKTATAATSSLCIEPLKAYKQHQQQHQCSHDYIQFNRNLSKL